MILILAVILAVGWLLGFTVFHVATAAIHFLLVFAVIAAIIHFVRGASSSGRPVGRLGG